MGKLFRIKVCGITSLADARMSLEAGADALGFNFCPTSPRYICPARARRMISRLPKRTVVVGVFVNRSPDEVSRIAQKLRLDYLQLHGEESPEDAGKLARKHKVIRAVRVTPQFRVSSLRNSNGVDAFLLDAYHRKTRGGTGRSFDWKIARRAARFGHIILAGGLTPGNVARAIRSARPAAVDVASGVESRPGKKDPARVRAFVAAAKKARGEMR